jgi:hypothetical protein
MKHTTNTLSTLYRSIDQTKISDKAKETLKKLRLATGNFVGKDEEAKQLFVDFFNKLKESKPIAVKTTPEYKKALRDAQRERGKALGEKRKQKSKEPKGTGNDIDASRPAKPYGWRMRGKHNYKKPTRADITEGRAYYEGRVNRADVKRKKYPMLERGGYMAEGGKLTNYKTSVIYYPNQEVVVYTEIEGVHKSILSRPYSKENKEYAIDFAKKNAEKNKGIYKGYYDISDALKMAKGGELKNYKTSVIYYPSQEVVVYTEIEGVHKSILSRPYTEANKEYAIDFAKKTAEKNKGIYKGYYDISDALKMAYGGYMAEGGEIKYLKSNGVSQSLVSNKSEATPMFIMDAEYYIQSQNKSKIAEVEKIDNSLPDRVGKNYIVKIRRKYEDGGYMAEGGMINHGFRSGDKIIEIYKGYGIIESKDVVEVIDPSKGSRYVVDHGNTMDEQIDGAKIMIDNMTPIELVDRIEIGTDRNGSMDRRGVEYAQGGKLSQGDINKKVNDNISQYINGLSKGEALYVLREILKEALIDANYGEFQDKVDRIFKGAKKFVLVKNADETEQLFFNVGKQVAKVCKWDRIQIVEAIKYTCSMNGYGQMASEISQIYSTKTGKLNYVPKNKIKYFLIKNEYKSGEFRNMYSIYESNDVLNGANILEKGGILEDYKYFAKNKVIIIGADGKPIFDTVNGAWVKKSATPIGEIEKTEILDVDSWDDFLKHGESKFWVDDVVYNKKTKSIGIVRVQDDKFGEVKTDADGNVNVDDLEHYDPSRYPYQKNDFVIAPSTKKEIEDRNLFKPFERRKYAKGGVFYTEKHKND